MPSQPPDDALDRFFNLSLDLLGVASAEGRFLRVNPAFTRTLGLTEEELTGVPWLELVHPDDVAPTMAEGARLAAGASTISFVNRYRCRDGSYRWLEWTAMPKDGLLYAVARDITERLRTEASLHAADRRLRTFVDRVLMAFIAVDPEGRVIEWNPEAEATFGWRRDEVMGKDIVDLIVPEPNRAALHLSLEGFVRAGADRRLEVEGLHRSGRVIPLEVSLSVLDEGGGRTYTAFLQDISERKRGQSARVQTAKLASLGEMVAGVAHEINNPLAFVSNNVAVLERDLGDLRKMLALYAEADGALAAAAPEVAARLKQLSAELDLPYTLESVDRIFRRTREGLVRIRGIVKDLRDFARLDNAEKEEADINEGILSTVNIVRGRARVSGVPDIELDLPPLPRLWCHPAKLNQVVLNLLSNAIDASPPGSPVTVRTRALDTVVTIEVFDRGPGVPPDLVDRIFDPFFTTKPQGQGTGLGLSISYGIVRDHGGTITVDTAPGGGARFVVSIPRDPRGG